MFTHKVTYRDLVENIWFLDSNNNVLLPYQHGKLGS